jgi:hypothetical protein
MFEDKYHKIQPFVYLFKGWTAFSIINKKKDSDSKLQLEYYLIGRTL